MRQAWSKLAPAALALALALPALALAQPAAPTANRDPLFAGFERAVAGLAAAETLEVSVAYDGTRPPSEDLVARLVVLTWVAPDSSPESRGSRPTSASAVAFLPGRGAVTYGGRVPRAGRLVVQAIAGSASGQTASVSTFALADLAGPLRYAITVDERGDLATVSCLAGRVVGRTGSATGGC